MLLLLKPTHSYTLSELFEIRQGVALNAVKGALNKKKQYLYKVVNLADLNKSFKQLDIKSLESYISGRPIQEDKLLTKDDYIISSKGVLKGFSMLFSDVNQGKQDKADFLGVIASNNFIILRPHKSTGVTFSDNYYMHNLLDLIILKIRNEAETKNNYLTISKLKKIEIELPLLKGAEKKKEFEKVFLPWKENLDAFIDSDKKLELYNSALMKELKIENLPL